MRFLGAFLAIFLCLSSVNGQDDLDLPVMFHINSQDSDSPQPSEIPMPPRETPSPPPPPNFFGHDLPTRSDSVVYLLDRSGSMMIEDISGQGIRWHRAREEAKRSISGLSPNIKFTVVIFDDIPEAWSPSLESANTGNKDSAKSWLDRKTFRGGTATGPVAFNVLVSWPENLMVILLTDGLPNNPNKDPDWHRRAIRQGNLQGAVINVFGIIPPPLAGFTKEIRQEILQMRAFCRGIASDSGGTYVDVQ